MPTYEIRKIERTELTYLVTADTWEEAKRFAEEADIEDLGEPDEEFLGNDGVYYVRNCETDVIEYEGD